MKNILVVDDSRFILAIVEDAIAQSIDAQIFTAKSYAEAQKVVGSVSFHLAILDVHLPDAEHGEVIDLLNRYDVPVIVLTGGMNERTKQIILQKEIIEYITKTDPKTIGYVASVAKRAISNYDKHVLVVDDSKSSRKLLRHSLEMMKLNVHEAENGREALELLSDEELDISLVLTDYNMPEIDGMELTMQLRQAYSKDQLSIIAISGEESESVATEFLRHGANDFIKKPFTFEEISVRVNVNLELIDLFMTTREMAYKDYMTGLYNRRHFFQYASTLYTEALRNNEPIAVAMLDIDRFKNINDTYGHDIGDQAIKSAANILASHLDENELLARFGGEEFCMLIQAREPEEVLRRMEWIRAMFEANIQKIGDIELNYTMSIGVCCGFSESVEEMVKCSDRALYDAKENGRNRVVAKSVDGC